MEQSEPVSPSTPTPEEAPRPETPQPRQGNAKTLLLAFGAGLAIPSVFLLGFLSGAAWGGGNNDSSAAQPTPPAPTAPVTPPAPTAPAAPDLKEPTPVPGTEDVAAPKGTNGPGTPYVFGNPSAPTVSIVEDFTCPFCALFEQQQGPGLTQAANDGKIQVKYYTVAFFGEGAKKIAEAAACAADQGAYQSYSVLLYEAQKPDHEGLSTEKLVELASDTRSAIGDVPAFEQCVKAGTYAGYVDSMTKAAEAATIPGTPSIFINGEFIAPDQMASRVTELLSTVNQG